MTGSLQSYLATQSDLLLNTTVEQEACPHNLAYHQHHGTIGDGGRWRPIDGAGILDPNNSPDFIPVACLERSCTCVG
jgi:hypothetical protein